MTGVGDSSIKAHYWVYVRASKLLRGGWIRFTSCGGAQVRFGIFARESEESIKLLILAHSIHLLHGLVMKSHRALRYSRVFVSPWLLYIPTTPQYLKEKRRSYGLTLATPVLSRF